MKFREEIAGLRALAVVPIVLFHAGFTFLPGGFVGVDVFFVISGYLITALIVRDLNDTSFSLWNFYRRRTARILPAMILVVAATLIFGYITLLPSEISGLTQSAISTLTFLSNVYFFTNTDYFAVSAEAMPLLHTWSLAVEEQYYIFYPLLLLIIYRTRPDLAKHIVMALTVLSFFGALWLARSRPDAAFYLLPARAWELGAGALVALGAFPRIKSDTLRQTVSLIGLALIFFSVIFIEPSHLFPAPLALAPVAGASLVIAYCSHGVSYRILAFQPMQKIGNISFSLYLWHWPVITFYRLETGNTLTPFETVTLTAVSVALAYCTYAWVERPCLKLVAAMRKSADRTVTLTGIFVLLSTVLAVALTSSLFKNWRSLPKDVAHVASFLDYRETENYKQQFRRGKCFISSSDSADIDPDCLALSLTKPNMVVLGDSHAAQFWRAIAERYTDFNVIQATASGCRPLLNAAGEDRCLNVVKSILEDLVPRGEVDTVILAGRWESKDIIPLRRTVDRLESYGVRVTVIGPTTEYDGELPAILARALLTGNADGTEHLRHRERKDLEDQIGSALKDTAAIYVPLHSIICTETGCTTLTKSGSPYQFDYGHLTLDAAREVVRGFPPLVPTPGE